MKTMIVYDSIFGNTEKVAAAVAGAFASSGGAGTLKAGRAGNESLTGVNLLIVGSPTRGFRPTPAIRNFLKGLPSNGLRGVKVAAFDTRMTLEDMHSKILDVMVPVFGYAAKRIADGLAGKGGEPLLPPEGFLVAGGEGPLKKGELERAAQWARKILAAAGGQQIRASGRKAFSRDPPPAAAF